MEQTTQKIFFKDLIFTVLYRWKALVITALIFALLLGGVAVVNNRSEVAVGGLSMTPEYLDLVDELKTQIEFVETNIEELEAHNKESVMMNLNPFSSYSSVVQLFVVPDEGQEGGYDPSALLLQSYRSVLLDNSAIDKLAEKHGMSNLCFRELLNFTSPEEKYLQITIYAGSIEQAEAYAADIQSVLTAAEEGIDQSVVAHNMVITTFFSGPKVDTTLIDKQNINLTKIKNWEAELATLENRLNQLEPSALSAASSNPMLFAIVGAFLGACIVVACAWCCYICGSKIYNAKVLENRTGIRILGCVASDRKRDPITRWFRKLDGRAMHTAPDAVTVNIRNLAKDSKKLLIMGNFKEAAMKELAEKLEESGISCVVCADPSVKADALEVLPECDKVVLVETCGQSRYEAVEWAIKTVEDHEKPLLGCVLING